MAIEKDPHSMSSQALSRAADDPNHPLHMHAKIELQRRQQREVSLDRLTKAIKHGSGTSNVKKAMGADKLKKDLEAMKAKLATEATDDEYHKTLANTKNSDEGIAALKKKHGMSHAKATATIKRLMGEAKDPEEYDNEGSMMKSQLRQICSANEKLMSMVKDDDNLPEWVQAKVTKATDYIRSVRDYLESEKMDESVQEYGGPKISRKKYLEQDPMKETKAAPKGYHFTKSGQLKKGDADVDGPGGKKLRADPLDKQRSKIPPLPEKTLTPAEKKKREEIAKAIERENPDMPINQKMAIATAQAKKVAEAYDEPQGQAKRMMSPLQKARMDKEKADRDADGKLKEKTGLKRDTLKSYIKKASKDAADRGMDAVDKAKSGDTVGFGKQFVKSRDRVKNVAKAVDKLEDTKPDAAEVMRKQQQMANISSSDKDKLAKIRAMLNKEKK